MPCRNEIRFIERCLRSLLANDYPVDRLEIIAVDGGSTDGTRALLSRYADEDARLTVLDNPGGLIPVSMNMGIRHGRGTVVLKTDAHAEYPFDYFSRCVRGLMESGADNVGGVLETCPSGGGALARTIARVLAHPFGSGNSRFRIGSRVPLEADTVAFGCYRRDVLERLGGYNEALVRSSDMDLNNRLRRAGGRILLVPAIVARYYPRAAFWSFVWRNAVDGFWTTYPLKFGGDVLRPRHATPLAAFVLVMVLAALSIVIPAAAWAIACLAGLYAIATTTASIQLAVEDRSLRAAVVAPAVFAGRHAAYAMGSLCGLLRAAGAREFWRRPLPPRIDTQVRPALAHDTGSLSIVIPAFNEERRLPAAIDAIDAYLRRAGVDYEIIVVDDGSTDRTSAVVEALAAGRRDLRLVRFPENRGKGAAVAAGILAARGRDVVFTDADLSTSIDQLPQVLGPLRDGFDMAMASRGLAGSTFVARQRWYRRKLGDAFGVLARLLLVRGFRDCQCGFKAFTRHAAVEIFSRMTSPTAIFDVEVVLLSARLGLRVAEVPVRWRHDPDSRLVYDLRGSLGLLQELLRLRRHWDVMMPPRALVRPVIDRRAAVVMPAVAMAPTAQP